MSSQVDKIHALDSVEAGVRALKQTLFTTVQQWPTVEADCSEIGLVQSEILWLAAKLEITDLVLETRRAHSRGVIITVKRLGGSHEATEGKRDV